MAPEVHQAGEVHPDVNADRQAFNTGEIAPAEIRTTPGDTGSMHDQSDILDPASPPQAPAAMKWIARIGITVFLIPFFFVGFGLLFGGSFFGGVGWFGALIGLPFIAVPTMMLAAVWLSPTGRPMRSGQAASPAATSAPAPPSAPAAMTACTYCGRPRAQGSAICESCGGH